MRIIARQQQGFSLIELMITLAIAVFLATVAVPSFNTTIQEYRTTSTTNAWVNAVRFARTEAISRNQAITLCTTAINGTSCDATTTWSAGWAVVDGQNNTLKYWEAPPGDVNLNLANNTIRFSGRGWLAQTVTLNAQNDHCSQVNDGRRVIQVNASGRVSVTREDC